MALWPFDNKKKKQNVSDEGLEISEEELEEYLKNNPPSEKVMEDISKPQTEEEETEESEKIPPLGPTPIPTNIDFRPPSVQKTQQAGINQESGISNQEFVSQSKPQPVVQSSPQTISETQSKDQEVGIRNQGTSQSSTSPSIIPANKPISSIQPAKQPSKFKNFCLGIIVFFIIIILAGAIWWQFLAIGTLIIAVTPSDARVTVGSRTAKSTDSLKLKPANYTIKIEKDGYITYEKEIAVRRLKTVEIKIELKQIPKPEKISQDKFSDFYLNSNQIYALSEDGKTLYRLTNPSKQLTENVNQEAGSSNQEAAASGQNYTKTAVTPDYLANVQNIIWHPKDTLAIFKIKQDKKKLNGTPFVKAEVADGQIMTWFYDFKRYDLVNQTATFWGADIGDIVWSPDGEEVYYYYAPAGGEMTLISASKNNQNLDRILNLKEVGIENPRLSISPDGKYLTLIPRSKRYETNHVYLFEILTKKLTKLVPEGQNLEAKFSPDSQKVIYSFYSANSEEPSEYSNLAVVGIDDGNKVDLKIRVFMNKTAISSDSKFVVVAQSGGKDSSDKFKQVDLSTGAVEDYIYQSEITVKPARILYSSGGDAAYFMADGYLYSLELVSNTYE